MPRPKAADAVGPANSRRHATAASELFATISVRGIIELAGAEVSREPIEIFDVNGEPLFHDYELLRDRAAIGTIRCAANRRLGSLVISIGHGKKRWNPDAARRMAIENLHARVPRARVVGTRLVCYAYPKIGVELEFETPGAKKTEKDIFDASNGRAVGNERNESNQFTRYSLLDRLASQAGEARRRFSEFERSVATGRPPRPLPPAAPPRQNPRLVSRIQQGLVLLSPYCPNSPIGLTHYAQITDFFCVDASSQMLLEHYGFNFTQNTIASAMGTSAANGGTTGAGLTSGFTSLTNNTLVLSFDGSATRDQQFQDAITEISANQPLFTQVPHHYRVCVGYYENTLLLGLPTFNFNRMIYIYDPWPWNPDECNPGAPYWEMWASSPVMWFGIVHHRTTPCP